MVTVFIIPLGRELVFKSCSIIQHYRYVGGELSVGTSVDDYQSRCYDGYVRD
jgi:hypothetical protein